MLCAWTQTTETLRGQTLEVAGLAITASDDLGLVDKQLDYLVDDAIPLLAGEHGVWGLFQCDRSHSGIYGVCSRKVLEASPETSKRATVS